MCQATENCGEASAKFLCRRLVVPGPDRKSTRLNSSHDQISYAVFCLKKKKKTNSLIYFLLGIIEIHAIGLTQKYMLASGEGFLIFVLSRPQQIATRRDTDVAAKHNGI